MSNVCYTIIYYETLLLFSRKQTMQWMYTVICLRAINRIFLVAIICVSYFEIKIDYHVFEILIIDLLNLEFIVKFLLDVSICNYSQGIGLFRIYFDLSIRVYHKFSVLLYFNILLSNQYFHNACQIHFLSRLHKNVGLYLDKIKSK